MIVYDLRNLLATNIFLKISPYKYHFNVTMDYILH